jgi:hypothetical protein
MRRRTKGSFEVKGHFYDEHFGGFVIGKILSGEFRIGMFVSAEGKKDSLLISNIEYIDDLNKKTFQNSLFFSEKPKLEYIKNLFPTGSVLYSYD